MRVQRKARYPSWSCNLWKHLTQSFLWVAAKIDQKVRLLPLPLQIQPPTAITENLLQNLPPYKLFEGDKPKDTKESKKQSIVQVDFLRTSKENILLGVEKIYHTIEVFSEAYTANKHQFHMG